MSPVDFIRRYMLSISMKEAKDQSRAFTSSHVVYSIKIKSALLGGKIKTEYIQNPAYPSSNEEIIEMFASDLRSGPLGGNTIKDFVSEFGYTDIVEALDIWARTEKVSRDFMDFFGQGGIEDLLSIEPE